MVSQKRIRSVFMKYCEKRNGLYLFECRCAVLELLGWDDKVLRIVDSDVVNIR